MTLPLTDSVSNLSLFARPDPGARCVPVFQPFPRSTYPVINCLSPTALGWELRRLLYRQVGGVMARWAELWPGGRSYGQAGGVPRVGGVMLWYFSLMHVISRPPRPCSSLKGSAKCGCGLKPGQGAGAAMATFSGTANRRNTNPEQSVHLKSCFSSCTEHDRCGQEWIPHPGKELE